MAESRGDKDLLAFTNPEHMSSDELKAFIREIRSRPLVQGLLLPPSHPAPMPPSTPPPIPSRRPRPKLYQNIDVEFSPMNPPKPIQVNCDFFTPTVFPSGGLLMPATRSTSTNASSLIFLSTTNNTSNSDSSSATMIVRKSPASNGSPTSSNRSNYYKALNLLANFEECFGSKTKSSIVFGERRIEALSPIMTSSRSDLRADLHASSPTLLKSPSPLLFRNKNEFNSLPTRRRKAPLSPKAKRLSLNTDFDSPTKKSFTNYNYLQMNRRRSSSSLNDLRIEDEKEDSSSSSSSSESSSLASVLLLPPSPFKTTVAPTPFRLPPPPIISNLARKGEPHKTIKKVSFMIRKFEDEEAEFVSPCSSDSSKQIIFANHDYFAAKGRHVESSASSSSSSIPASSSSCSSSSSSSSSSSGYKSNQSSSLCARHSGERQSPGELNCFVEESKERLARLKMRRRFTSNTLPKSLENKKSDKLALASLDTSVIKNVSAKLFQKLLSTRQSPIRTTLSHRPALLQSTNLVNEF